MTDEKLAAYDVVIFAQTAGTVGETRAASALGEQIRRCPMIRGQRRDREF